MGRTKIEWVRGDDGAEGISWNALRAVRVDETGKTRSANHCEHVNEACRFCYSERTNPRLGGLPFKPGHRKDYRFEINERTLRTPLHLRKPTRIFVESTSDTFGDWWPRELVHRLYAVMQLTPQHTYINLSKRPERRRQYLSEAGTPHEVHFQAADLTAGVKSMEGRPLPRSPWPLPNVIEGTSVSCQPEADEFVPILLETPAALRVVSAEPLLGPLDFVGNGRRWLRNGLGWIICGGESGPHARPMHPDWARSLRDQCAAAGVPYFLKQLGEYITAPVVFDATYQGGARVDTNGHGQVAISQAICWDDGTGLAAVRVGKTNAGRLLDGREHNDFPKVPA